MESISILMLITIQKIPDTIVLRFHKLRVHHHHPAIKASYLAKGTRLWSPWKSWNTSTFLQLSLTHITGVLSLSPCTKRCVREAERFFSSFNLMLSVKFMSVPELVRFWWLRCLMQGSLYWWILTGCLRWYFQVAHSSQQISLLCLLHCVCFIDLSNQLPVSRPKLGSESSAAPAVQKVINFLQN